MKFQARVAWLCPEFLRPIDRFTPQDLDRNRVLVFVDLRLERPIESPEQEIFCCCTERFGLGEILLRGCEQIALSALFFALQYLKGSPFLARKLGILHTKIPERIRNAHHDAIRTQVTEHAADRSLEQLYESIKVFAADAFPEQSAELCLVNRPDESLVDLEFCAKSLFRAGPIPKSTRVAFAGGFEAIHGVYPTTSCGDFFGETHQAYADRPKAPVIGWTTSRQRAPRIEVPPAIAELQLRLRQTFYRYCRRHRSILLRERPGT